MNGSLENLRVFWSGIGIGQKMAVSAAAILAVVAVILLVSWATKPDMQVAFSGLSPEDASAMSEKLAEDGIPYQLTGGGTTIQVPAEKIAEARVGLASSGLPKGGSAGFELFDNQSFGATDFTQRVNYQRALEGELSRTISQLDEVDSARVHIALGKESVFVDKDKPATASVVVKLGSGESLTGSQVKGIIRLVSGSVEGLKPESVNLTDMTGNMLSGEDGGVASGGDSGQQTAKARYERDMEGRLNSLLATAFGDNKVVTKVAADMDFDQTEEKSTTYTPVVGGAGIVSEESTSAEDFQGSKLPGTSVGTSTNIPGLTGASGGSTATSAYNKNADSRTFKVNQVNTTKKKASGTVTRQTVAVLVDGKLTQAEADRVRGIVEAGAGIDATRGDSVRVESMVFNKSAAQNEEKALASAAQRQQYLDIGKYALLGVGAIIFFLFLMSRLRKPAEVVPSGEPFFRGQEAMEAIPQMGQIAAPQQPTMAEVARRSVEAQRKSLEDMVEQRPDDAARLLRSWLNAG